jgi:heme-degrading monooxygenase HmoA
MTDGPASPFRVLLRMRIRPGEGVAFGRAWQAGADVIAGQADNLGQWLARDTEDADTYYVISDWADEASFRAYEHGAVHAEHLARLRPYRAEGEMATMSVLSGVPPVAVEGQERVRVLIYAAAPESDPDGVEKAYHEISTALRGVPGLLGNELLREMGSDRARFVVMSEWESFGAFQRWEKGADHRNTTAPLRPYQDTSGGRSFALYAVNARY